MICHNSGEQGLILQTDIIGEEGGGGGEVLSSYMLQRMRGHWRLQRDSICQTTTKSFHIEGKKKKTSPEMQT